MRAARSSKRISQLRCLPHVAILQGQRLPGGGESASQERHSRRGGFDGQLVKISRKSRVRESNRSFLRALTFVELVFSCFFLRTLPGNILGELLVSYRIGRIVTPAQFLQLMNGSAP